MGRKFRCPLEKKRRLKLNIPWSVQCTLLYVIRTLRMLKEHTGRCLHYYDTYCTESVSHINTAEIHKHTTLLAVTIPVGLGVQVQTDTLQPACCTSHEKHLTLSMLRLICLC